MVKPTTMIISRRENVILGTKDGYKHLYGRYNTIGIKFPMITFQTDSNPVSKIIFPNQ